MNMDLQHLRQEYTREPIDVDSVDPCPFKQFESWFAEATDAKIVEPNAMVVASVGPDRQPTQRTVLLKTFDRQGFVFFTNYQSRKALQIAVNPHVSLLFPWYALQRQVEVNGVADKVSAAESLKYFAVRPRGSQLGAWVSQQSSVVSNRSLLKNKLAELKEKFAAGSVPMPPAWGGFRVRPQRIEFWQGGKDRLHDRIEYRSIADSDSWQRQRLAP
jgi:pyridoxamine 5'-phosphate oxidase